MVASEMAAFGAFHQRANKKRIHAILFIVVVYVYKKGFSVSNILLSSKFASGKRVVQPMEMMRN